jgi:putative photosynthetic complex assembly protein 2
MSLYAAPVVYALFVWWFSTGLIIYLDNLPQVTVRWSMLGATAVLAASLQGLAISSTDTSVAGTYIAFTCGLLAWGWHEIGFFSGAVTGPRPLPCPEGCRGWRRLGYAILACLYHEVAIKICAAAIFALTQHGPNHVGLWTFMIIWAMRQSSKFNVYLGVLNLNENFLPEALGFLKSYLVKKPMNPLFPFSVTSATIVAVLLVEHAAHATSPATASGTTFLATILILGILEHWFLVIPLPAAELWNWSLRSRDISMVGHAGSAEAEVLPSWSTRLDLPCDREGLAEVLERVARGAFGQVDRVSGVVRAGSGWVRFYVADGRSSVADVTPGEQAESPGESTVVAFGRRVDKAGLQAAFAACALPVAA